VALGLLLLPVAGKAQGGTSQRAIELSRGVTQSLLHLQEVWLQWVSAFYEDDREAAAAQVTELTESIGRLGFEGLPDLSVAATARAVEAARQGDLTRAAWALDDAEALDPGRPETAFGRAIVAWEDESYSAAAWQQLVGYRRLLSASPRGLLAYDLLLAALAVALLAGGCYLLVELATKGPALYWSFLRRFSTVAPGAIAHLLTIVLLLWPLAMPRGLLWALLYWSVLLWGFGSISERVVTTALWALLAATPFVLTLQQQRVAVLLTPPLRAVEALAAGKLYGGLFSDLAVLPAVLPDSSAVAQLLGDVHRTIGQWEEARNHYTEVLEDEPENIAALIDLGAYHARKGDHGTAVQLFQRATAADPTNAAAYYNLSQAYSDAYQFGEQREALARARSLDDAQVTRWIQEPSGGERVVSLDGGLARREEIARQLKAAAAGRPSEPLAAVRRWVPAGLAVLALVLALVLRRLLPIADTPPPPRLLGRGLQRVARFALPGLPSASIGNGGRAYGAWLVVALAAMLFGGGRLLYSLPLGLHPGDVAPTVAAALTLLLFYASRLWLELR
jgi:tetratricopeptide (TPR) repeat protein